jgi:phosphoglycolate phosphatase-like HAD superfamily hydrolase
LTKVAVERAETIVGRDLDRDEVLDVGDTPLDITAAHAANTVAVGVATGHYSKEQLAQAGADHVLGTLEEDLPL